MRFAPEYVNYVLTEHFDDAKELFLAPLMSIHYAHLVMLAATGIVTPDDAHALRVGLDTVSQPDVRASGIRRSIRRPLFSSRSTDR